MCDCKNVLVLFWKNLKSNFSTLLSLLTLRFLYILGSSGPRWGTCKNTIVLTLRKCRFYSPTLYNIEPYMICSTTWHRCIRLNGSAVYETQVPQGTSHKRQEKYFGISRFMTTQQMIFQGFPVISSDLPLKIDPKTISSKCQKCEDEFQSQKLRTYIDLKVS